MGQISIPEMQIRCHQVSRQGIWQHHNRGRVVYLGESISPGWINGFADLDSVLTRLARGLTASNSHDCGRCIQPEWLQVLSRVGSHSLSAQRRQLCDESIESWAVRWELSRFGQMPTAV